MQLQANIVSVRSFVKEISLKDGKIIPRILKQTNLTTVQNDYKDYSNLSFFVAKQGILHVRLGMV